MLKTKRFSIPKDLANGLRDTINSATSNGGQLQYDVMSLDKIEPDPMNPRNLLISREEMLNGINKEDEFYEKKMKELEALSELATSIRKIGIKNAIEVYKHEDKYRIVTGERRFLASILANQKTIPARISQKPGEFNLRYTQWVENINRQGLSLLEKYNNLILIAKAYEEENKAPLTDKGLKEILGVSDVQAYRYSCLLNSDDEVVRLIMSGKVNNLKIIQEITAMKNFRDRKSIISWIMSSKKEVTSIDDFTNDIKAGVDAKKAKARSHFSLGSVSSPKVAKTLIEIILSNSKLGKYKMNFEKVDWADSKNVKKAIRTIFTLLEKEFSTENIND